MSEVTAAIAWYSPEEYIKFKEASDDPEVWSEKYSDWKANLEEVTKDLEAEGVCVAMMELYLEEFQSWCLENKEKNIAEVRSRYAIFLHQQNGEGDGGDE